MGIFSCLRNNMISELDPRLHQRFYEDFENNPVMVYDIGAAGGLYSPYIDGPQIWAPIAGFEPHPDSLRRLREMSKSPHITLHNQAISNHDGPLQFNAALGKARTKSSLLSIESLGLESRPELVPGLRLDSIENTIGLAPASFLKLDTEGNELDILNGGQTMLRETVLGIRVEVAFWRHNNDAAPFWEIDKLLTDQGFILFDLQVNRSDIRSIGGRKDKIRSGDALYLKNFCHNTMPDSTYKDARIQLLKLMSLCVTWRYLNYGLELADYGRNNSLLNEQEFSLIVQPWLRTVDISDYLPQFYGRNGLARLFDFLSYTFNPNIKKGVPYPFNGLGNHWVVSRIGGPPSEIDVYCPLLDTGPTARHKVIKIDTN